MHHFSSVLFQLFLICCVPISDAHFCRLRRAVIPSMCKPRTFLLLSLQPPVSFCVDPKKLITRHVRGLLLLESSGTCQEFCSTHGPYGKAARTRLPRVLTRLPNAYIAGPWGRAGAKSRARARPLRGVRIRGCASFRGGSFCTRLPCQRFSWLEGL